MTYTPTIGLEVHAEMLTDSKLFCGCRNDPASEEPNQYICPVCVGYPGTLPVLNKRAVEQILRVGVALEGDLASFTEFDRKHYFYPDIPKGYQITQHAYPLVQHAVLCGVAIQRIHLEEDTAKIHHDICPDGSVIDFNRSGVPLMELVTDPTMHTAEEARLFADTLQQTLWYLGVSRARMEMGEMRIEVNISVSNTDVLGTKVEVKNLNSFKAVCGAIAFETDRQIEILERGERVVQETRGWNEHTNKTFSQRKKESTAEYRYMPEPDLPKYRIDQVDGWDRSSLLSGIVEMPEVRLRRYVDTLGIDAKKAGILVRQKALGDIFDGVVSTVAGGDAVRLAVNYLTSDVLQYVEVHGAVLFERIDSKGFSDLVQMLLDGQLSSRGAKEVIAVLAREGGSPREIAEQKNLFQESDEGMLGAVIETVLRDNAGVADEYRSGKEQSLQFLIGQVMKETGGAANPATVQSLLKKALS